MEAAAAAETTPPASSPPGRSASVTGVAASTCGRTSTTTGKGSRSRTRSTCAGSSELSPPAEAVRRRERRADLGVVRDAAGERREGHELVDDDVAVAVDALVAAAHEDERLAADDRSVALVDGRRDDEVDLAELVLHEHEDDAVRGRRALARDRHSRDGDEIAVPGVLELPAREHL